MKKVPTLLALLAAFAAAPAFAQAIGTVSSVNGVATVVTGGTATAVTKGMPLLHGSRILTTSSSSTTVQMNDGCTLTVPPGHAVTILSTLTCKQLQAALQPLTPSGPSTAVMGQGQGGNPPIGLGVNAPVAVWAAAMGLATAYDATRDNGNPPISGR
ncbi:hypothetical protein H8N03_22335 [Ramlibacter sp. USB13]|uniref:Uncharacterized protein n=1 Tax=Ramlibacter cellulosilyticus TaxID=2764187 RepID=A0A923SH97_9BURK|nr:hypothetical protein [Ramlibacter cellulosilyticus]MBC5785697.1 hypothetical protein [Ramlibacter cellulosilyticus]